MSTPAPIDTAALNLMLSELRLPTIKALWPQFTAQADREGWPAARLLSALTEHEIADRARRRFLRRLGEARLPSGKTLDSFDFSVVPTLSKAHVMALCAGRPLARRRLQPAAHWSARNRQDPSLRRHRPGSHRARLPRAVHPHHRSRATPAGRAPRVGP